MGHLFERIRPHWFLAIAGIASAVALLAHVSTSRASGAGTNGSVLFTRSEDMWSMDPGGVGAFRLTNVRGTEVGEIDGGEGIDQLVGGPGDDRLLAFDGSADTLDGGPGNDRARADRGLDSRVLRVEGLRRF
jgi:Ca2+-binding RTX toxin-like protein